MLLLNENPAVSSAFKKQRKGTLNQYVEQGCPSHNSPPKVEEEALKSAIGHKEQDCW